MAPGPAQPRRWEAGPSWARGRSRQPGALRPFHSGRPGASGLSESFSPKQQPGSQSVRFLRSRLTQPPGSPGSSLEEVVQLPAVPPGHCGHPGWSQGALLWLGETSSLLDQCSPSPALQSPEATVPVRTAPKLSLGVSLAFQPQACWPHPCSTHAGRLAGRGHPGCTESSVLAWTESWLLEETREKGGDPLLRVCVCGPVGCAPPPR